MAQLPGDVHLLLIGDGEGRPATERQIQGLGLQQRVRLLGSCDDDTLARALAGADLLCLPSVERREAFGLGRPEARRAGPARLAPAAPCSGPAQALADGPGVT